MENMQGRPQLFPEGKQLSVLVSAEEYRALCGLVEHRRAAVRPAYNFGDLLRGYIRRGLAHDLAAPVRSDPKDTPARQLFALARRARRIAQELENK